MVFLEHCATLVTKGWNQSGKKKSSFAISAKHLLKRRHPLYPLTSRQGNAQTACHSDMETKTKLPLLSKIKQRNICQGTCMHNSNNSVYIHTLYVDVETHVLLYMLY